jgi:hypothetical protein
MSTLDDMIKEIKQELTNGVELDELRDNSGEWIDGYLPVYNNRIIEEWQNMPSDYDDRGAAELGLSQEISIINLMSLDLYLYYGDLFSQALDAVESELDELVSVAD